jgi:hypothetical protein
MPLQRCTTNGKRGWKWGSSGKCYLSKAAAEKQGRAISISKARKKGHKILRKK